MVFVRSIPGQQQTFSCIPCYLLVDAAIPTPEHELTLPTEERGEEYVLTELTF